MKAKTGIENMARQGEFGKIKGIIKERLSGLEYGDAIEIRSPHKKIFNSLKNYLGSKCGKDYYTKSTIVMGGDNNGSDIYVLHIFKSFNIEYTQKDAEEVHKLIKECQALYKLKKAKNKINYAQNLNNKTYKF